MMMCEVRAGFTKPLGAGRFTAVTGVICPVAKPTGLPSPNRN
jgi:hypothetical protein